MQGNFAAHKGPVMPVRKNVILEAARLLRSHPSRKPSLISRTALLAGVSAFAMLAYAMPAEARCIGCGIGGAGSAGTAAPASALAHAQEAGQGGQKAPQART